MDKARTNTKKLIGCLDAETEAGLSAAWKEEVRRRCREIDDDSVELLHARDVFARGYAALG